MELQTQGYQHGKHVEKSHKIETRKSQFGPKKKKVLQD